MNSIRNNFNSLSYEKKKDLIFQLSKEYDKERIKPSGRKTDWIGKQIGISGRTVRNYLSNKDRKKEDVKQIDYTYAEYLFRSKLKRKCKIRNHKVTLNFKDTNDLNRLIEDLDLLEDV